MTHLVLLHAFPVNRHLWDDQVEYLTKAGRRVLAPDLAGFGESRVPQEATMAALAEKVRVTTGSMSPIRLLPYKDVYGAGFEDMARRVPDLTKLERAIGYRPRTSLETIIADVVAEQRAALARG